MRFKSFLTLLIFLLPFVFQGFLSAQVIRKKQVTFKASDGLLVSADLYQSKKSNPYIILFHQELSCRAEFDSITGRFAKMNLNCLSVDLRTGENVGFRKNETATRAREEGYPRSLEEGSKDMIAAIDYISKITGKGITLFGSASSASLALMIGRDNRRVKSVIAFSPGDYFAPINPITEILANYPKPVFVACTADEEHFLFNIENFPGFDKILFKPISGKGKRGTEALLKENNSSNEYWLSLLIFFKSLQKT